MECCYAFLAFVFLTRSVVISSEYGQCSKGRTDFLPGVIQGFFSSLNATDCELAQNTQFIQYDPSNGEIFDFIIVGAGPAGSVLANKLSANPNWRVLLLEAGGDPTMTSEIPGLAFFSQRTDIDWQYNTVQEDGLYWGMAPGGSVYWPRGKGIGGSTLLNAMFVTRGNPEDYNAWLAAGNPNWGFTDLLPHFIEIENMKAEEVLSCDQCMRYHGTKGELSVESFTNGKLDQYSQIIVDGLRTLGFGLHPDYNNPEMLIKGGYYFIQGSLKNGKRCNAGKAFLAPVQNRKNLRISKNSFVTKILIDKKKMDAYGVEFKNRFGETIQVFSDKEVIVSAGAINTPQLMMLSGIGPKKLLEAQGIESIKHSPYVGANLQDHPNFVGIVITIDKQFPASDKSLTDQLFEYLSRASGVMLNLGPIGSNVIFINSGNSSNGYPDIEMILSQFDKNSPSVAQIFGAFSPEIIKLFTDINENKTMLVLRAIALRPYSRGRLFLKSKNPEDHPKLYSGYFKDTRDFTPFISAIRVIEKLVKSKPMQDVGAKLELVDYPRCKQFEAGSDDYWACAIRYLVSTTYHQCCTMKMGPDTDKTAVVDSTLKVKNITSLRVVDMSVPPTLVSAHTQVTTYVIAHKAADMILDEYSTQTNINSNRN